MNEAHAGLAIEQHHFDSVAVHLVGTLRELGVPEDIVGEVGAAITPLSSPVVNTPTRIATA
jgi:hemoglobin